VLAFIGTVVFAIAFGFYMQSLPMSFMALGVGFVVLELTSFFGKVLVQMNQRR
jgi:uncharacterized membrane protein YjjB (DUF3815 family)